ncbi:helix-turn-helix transcriptional regulator [Chryseobacterium sp.]|uniref:helix-turn-helix transcriptional regulator n=1 Tax=Chryseobacterium sp. TaxID=1871047 RepID=UPI0025C57A0A|nr:helix-turn-helix transcriptional regulator [Chryseobacterium sp.]
MQKEKLRFIRKSKGITQKQMADFLCTAISNYCRKENGEVKIIKNEWEKIAKFLDVAIEDIFEEDRFPDSTGIKIQNHINTSMIESLQDYIRLLKDENTQLRAKIELLENI